VTPLDGPDWVERTTSTALGWPKAPRVGTVTSQVVSVGHLTGASVVPKVTVMMPSAEKRREPLSTMVWPAPPEEGETLFTTGAPADPAPVCEESAGVVGVVGAGRLVGGTDELDGALVVEGTRVGEGRAVAGTDVFPAVPAVFPAVLAFPPVLAGRVVPADVAWRGPFGSVRTNTTTAARTTTARAAVARTSALAGRRGPWPP
jgi:hypothetical protein